MPPELLAAFTTLTDMIVDNWLTLALLGTLVSLGIGYIRSAGRKAR